MWVCRRLKSDGKGQVTKGSMGSSHVETATRGMTRLRSGVGTFDLVELEFEVKLEVEF